jgi:phage terminase small subunit
MSEHGEKLRRKQELAISVLLASPNLTEAAQAVGVADSTLRRWLQRDDFQAAYRRARRETVSQAVAHVQRVSGEAVETLRTIMNDGQKPSSACVTVARVIL